MESPPAACVGRSCPAEIHAIPTKDALVPSTGVATRRAARRPPRAASSGERSPPPPAPGVASLGAAARLKNLIPPISSRPGQLPRTKNQITPTGPLTSSHAPTQSPNKLTAPDASLLAARPLLPYSTRIETRSPQGRPGRVTTWSRRRRTGPRGTGAVAATSAAWPQLQGSSNAPWRAPGG